jgi:molybdopterin converting factor small subunit
MNRHTVRLFAHYAELLGSEQVEVMLPPMASVADLVAALRALPGGASLPERPFVAMNLAQAAWHDIVPPGAEVALLPPLAGG